MSQSRTVGDFRSLFKYNRWASEQLIATMEEADSVPPRAADLLMHLLRAQDVWHGRIDGGHADLELWIDASLEDCIRRAGQTTRRYKNLLGELSAEDLSSQIAYENSKGISFETPLREVLNHVVNHSTHHRGQIALVLRENEVVPPQTDYIFYLREQ